MHKKNGFRSVAFRGKICPGIDEVQLDLDEWLRHYNHERAQSGKCCRGKALMRTFADSIPLAGRSFPTVANLTGSARENLQVSDQILAITSPPELYESHRRCKKFQL